VTLPSTTLRARLNISRLALAHPRLTVIVWVLVALAGALAYRHLRLALFPDVTFPLVIVTADVPGLEPAAAESVVTLPVEQRLQGVRDLKRLESTSWPGKALVAAEFEVGVSLREASRRVDSALAGLELPGGAAPKTRPIDINESPVVTYVLLGEYRTPAQLMGTALGTFLPAIEKVPGVLRVVPLGVDPAAVAALAGAAVDTALPHTVAWLNGRQGVALEVVKEAGANTIEVVRSVDSVVRRLQWDNMDLHAVPAVTQADFIRGSTRATTDALWLAVALSVLVIFPFLRSWKATAISALAIPISLLGTFVVMKLAGFGLETLTLLALALVIGIIVDDAIVDVENIQRHLDRGDPPHVAAVAATDEIGLTVTAATLTIVAVFLPVGLMGGVTGIFFRPFGLTISAAVVTSLLVARTLSPLLSSWWLRPARPARPGGNGAGQAGWPRFAARYRDVLSWALEHRALVVLLALLSLVAGVAIIPLIPKGFIPRFDRNEFLVVVTAPRGTSLDSTSALTWRVAEFVRRDPGVADVFAVAGTAGGDHDRAILHVRVRDERGVSTGAVRERIRRRLPAERGTDLSVQDVPLLAIIAQKPLQLALVGDDRAALAVGAARAADHLRTLPGVTDVRVTGVPDGMGHETLERKGGRPAAHLNANLVGGYPIGAATREVERVAPTLLPPGVSLALGGESAQAADVFGEFAISLGLATLCVVAVLWFLFRSWQDPLVIALSLPLSGVGAMLGLFVSRTDFGMASLLGLIFLLGLVNKNAILLVDHANQLRSGGMSLREAILAAGPIRLRPILMTTSATILGMLPIALGFGEGAELRAPMAVAIIGGLFTSTVLSLVVVPVLYAIFDRVHPRFQEARSRRSRS
jgi:multidrug efflux pump subunit AcrB